MLAGRRCLVVGGGGFIGTNLCRALRDAGAAVTGFGRPPVYRDALAGCAWIEAELTDLERLRPAVRANRLVFHLVGGTLPAQSNLDPALGLRADVLPSIGLLEACRDAGTEQLVFVSSGGTVYGRTGDRPTPETAPTDPISAYGIGKLAIEKYLALFEYLHGLRYVVLRVANPYGPFHSLRRAQGIVGTLLANASAGRPTDIWGDGSVVRDFVFVDDVVQALIAAASYAGRERVFNVGSGTGMSLHEVIDSLTAIAGEDRVRVRFNPGRAADVPINILDIGRIAAELDWRPRVGWAAGVTATIAWLDRQRDPMTAGD